MADFNLDPDTALLVASRGTGPEHGLTRWIQREGRWEGKLLDRVNQLSSLARHPALPVLYGTSRMGAEGDIHAWRIEGDAATSLGERSSEGGEPCHLAVDPTGSLLIFANYNSCDIGLQRLDSSGGFAGPVSLLRLHGRGPEAGRQDDAHPHQLFFIGNTLVVIDLGADLVREYAVDLAREGARALVETRGTAVTAGCGPRHGVVLPDGRLALTGELGSNLVVGRLGEPADAWVAVRSTLGTGPARTRHLRNYPGDIQRAPDGRHVYFANRGYDTVTTFDVTAHVPVLVSEVETGTAWPQHLLATKDHLLVADWDSSQVRCFSLQDGRPAAGVTLFDCPGAGWLMLWDRPGFGTTYT